MMSLFDRTKNIGLIIASHTNIDTEVKKSYYYFKNNQFFLQSDKLEKHNTKMCSFRIYKSNYLNLLDRISDNIKLINISSDKILYPLNIDLCKIPTSISDLNINDYIFYRNLNQKYDSGKILNISKKRDNVFETIFEVENINDGKNLFVEISQIIFSSSQFSFRCLEVCEYEDNAIKNVKISPINETILKEKYTYRQNTPKYNIEMDCQFNGLTTQLDTIMSPISLLDI